MFYFVPAASAFFIKSHSVESLENSPVFSNRQNKCLLVTEVKLELFGLLRLKLQSVIVFSIFLPNLIFPSSPTVPERSEFFYFLEVSSEVSTHQSSERK